MSGGGNTRRYGKEVRMVIVAKAQPGATRFSSGWLRLLLNRKQSNTLTLGRAIRLC